LYSLSRGRELVLSEVEGARVRANSKGTTLTSILSLQRRARTFLERRIYYGS